MLIAYDKIEDLLLHRNSRPDHCCPHFTQRYQQLSQQEQRITQAAFQKYIHNSIENFCKIEQIQLPDELEIAILQHDQYFKELKEGFNLTQRIHCIQLAHHAFEHLSLRDLTGL